MASQQFVRRIIKNFVPLLAFFFLCVYGDQTYSSCTHDKRPYDYVIVTDDNNINSEFAFKEDELLAEKMRGYGLSVIRKSFSDPDFDWCLAKSAIIRTAWDRFRIWEKEWFAFFHELKSKTALVNSFDLFEENENKSRYLQRLVENGINIPPTQVISRGSKNVTLRQIRETQGWEAMVIKPNTGNIGLNAFKVTDENMDRMETTFDNMLKTGDILVQEFQTTFVVEKSTSERPREVSTIFFDKKFSHAIAKTPAVGKFKVHSGFNWNHIATEEEINFGKKVISAFEKDYPILSYARVDMFRDNSNELAVMEFAATSCDLFFRTNNAAPDNLAKHLYELSRNITGDATCDTE